MMGRKFWGIALVLFGAFALLQTLGYPVSLPVWPAILTLVGLGFLANSIRHFSWMQLALGLWLGAAGVADILADSGVITFGSGLIWRSGWPILLVAIGLSMMFGRRWWGHWDWRDGDWKHWSGPRRVKVGRVEGGVGPSRVGGQAWRLDKDLHVNHGMGDVKVDLTTAEITEGEHSITVDAGVGDVRIWVPDNVNIAIEASTNVGQLYVLGERRDGLGLSVNKTVVAPGSNIQLNIRASLGVGDLKVISAPAATKVIE